MNIIFLILSIISFYYYFRRHRDILNPNMIFLIIWFLTCSISCVDHDDFMNPWSSEMYFVTIISGVSFWVGSLFVNLPNNNSLKNVLVKQDVSILYRKILYILFFICFLCNIIEWINGGAKILLFNDIYDAKSEIDGNIPYVHYGTIFLPFVGVMAIFSYLSSVRKKNSDLFIVIIILLSSIFFHISRGEILILIFSYIFIFTRYNRIKFVQIVTIISITLYMLIGIMLIRVNNGSIVFSMNENPYYSVIYSYIATSYANLNDLIQSNVSYHPLGDATLAPLWTITGLRDNANIVYFEQLDVFNARTYLYAFYHDFKILGVIVVPFILGNILAYVYKRIYLDSPYWILLLAMMQKAIFVPFFGNYFFGEMVILFPYLLATFIILTITKS